MQKTTGEIAYILWQGQEFTVNILKDGYLDQEQVTYQNILIDEKIGCIYCILLRIKGKNMEDKIHH